MENFGIVNSTWHLMQVELGLYYVLINVILGKWVIGDFSCLVQGDPCEYCTCIIMYCIMHWMYNIYKYLILHIYKYMF